MTTKQFPKTRAERDLNAREQQVLELYNKAEERYGPGVIGIICGEMSRWSDFQLALAYLIRTRGTLLAQDPGVDIVKQCNNFVHLARQRGNEWLMILGDDHIFDGDLALRLLAHDVDVVVPNVLQRSAPFYPVVYQGIRQEDGHHMIKFDLPKSGLHEVFAAGSAGMMIRKHVIDALPEKPFRRTEAVHNEDLEFCRLTREAGFKIWCDVDTQMAHKGSMNVWPVWSDEYGWGAKVEVGPPQAGEASPVSTNFFRLSPGSAALKSA